MPYINRHYAMTAHELGRELLEGDDHAIVTTFFGRDTYTIYKMEHAADETQLILFLGTAPISHEAITQHVLHERETHTDGK